MTKRRHNYPGFVDRALDKLSLEAKESWAEYATGGKTLIELQAWWRDRGLNVPSVDALSLWRKKHMKVGDRAQTVLAVMERTQGITPKGALEYSTAIAIILAEEVRERLDAEYSRNDAMVLLNCLKECRSAAIALSELESKADRIDSVLSGSYELASRVKRMSEGDPRSEWMEAILQSGLTSIEEEIKSSQLAAKA